VSFVVANGVNIATTDITRDGVTEKMELTNVADAVTGLTQSVTAPGVSGTDAAAVQGITGGIAMPVSGTVTLAAGTAAIGTVSVTNQNVTDASASAVGIPANAGAFTIIKNLPGKLCRIVVTATGTGPLNIYNNATGANTGMVLGTVPANAQPGQSFDCHMPASAGISCPVQANNPAVSVSFS
jgi:hypothetical protein